MKIKVKLLRNYMKQNKLSALGLAKKLNVSLVEIQKLLKGDSVGVETARKFIRYFTANEAQRLIDWQAIGKENPLAKKGDSNEEEVDDEFEDETDGGEFEESDLTDEDRFDKYHGSFDIYDDYDGGYVPSLDDLIGGQEHDGEGGAA